MKPLSAGDPTTVGPYRLLGVLGVGGMGRVYFGRSRAGRPVAIKVIRSELAEDPAFRLRFDREVAAARSVSPLYTAAVVDADPDAELPWLATTYIDGPSLEERVSQSGPLPPAAVLTLAAGLAEALASIHSVGLVHRDLKPSNVLIHDSGPHIIDFGIALADGVSRMTTSLVVGTPSYMAPERIHGSEAGPAGDIFSLGATLVFAATGHSVVHEGTMYAQIMQLTTGRFDLGDLPAPLRPLVVRCTSRRPADRPTAEELTRILAASGVAAPAPDWHNSTAEPPEVTMPARGFRLDRRTLLVAGGAAVMAAAVGASRVLPRQGRPSRPASRAGSQRVRWMVKTGAASSGTVLPGPVGGSPIVVIGRYIVATDGLSVFGLDTDGGRRWSRTLSLVPVSLRRWGDAVVVLDTRRLWLIDPASGRTLAPADAADGEERTAAPDNSDQLPVHIRGLVLSPATAYLSLGTAMLALRRSFAPLWRTPRPAPVGGLRPSIGTPLVAGGNILVADDVSESVANVSLYDTFTGAGRWSTRYARTPSVNPPDDDGEGGPPPPRRRDGPPPTGDPPPGGEPPHERGPAHDDAWDRSEARLAGDLVVIRDAHQVHALRLSDGSVRWAIESPHPATALEIVAGQVVVAADELRAFDLGSARMLWHQDLRGARITPAPDGAVVAVSEGSIALLRSGGQFAWQEPLPASVAGGRPAEVTVDRETAYVVFQPPPGQTLGADVVAFDLR